MKNSHSFPTGPVLMILGFLLMALCAWLASPYSWLSAIAGLLGFVLFFVGFRVAGGPNYIACPHCGVKIYNGNRWNLRRRGENVLRCPKCQTILRTDGGIII